MGRSLFHVLVLALVASMQSGCRRGSDETRSADGARTRLVLKYQPLWGPPGPFRELLSRFEEANPGVELVTEALPNASDLAHQFFLTSLEGGAQDFDVLVVDVVWVPEFARAGWVADVSAAFPPERLREEFLPGPVEAVVVDGRTYAVPWYLDVGVLYYRTDLVPRAPRTYAELEAFAREARARRPALQGYVWQGRQYEGLSCNVYEALWGHGGEAMEGGRVLLDTKPAREALAYLRGLVVSGVSPQTVTGFSEEESRRVFQEGRAVFMRNWPYAWSEAQKEDSPIRGKVGIAPLPTVDGEPGYGALGGWQLAVNAHVSPERRRLAERLIAHLTSPEANLVLALHYARNPPRTALYDDPRLKDGAPFIASLREMVERARPRPVTPYYNLVSDVLQSEFSAAVAGLRTPEEALRRAQRQVDHLTGEAE
ncbi:ABC transporter substrate-binding protein [Myxococcus stipitatus]|uniref:ABC transporter substrate-binding protein n=1 Tax=Myxococcus stipitatus TaxID=83455 RepID=UPI001F2D931D|nr:ABC transporter substrate-binding protein [Myxococcus stipitatus]MCE9671846.1 ABC transporter substrate-binding protein [Myxococcus stipitatus]